jgi:hypothetical protein
MTITPCRFQGKVYSSISEAARETGFHRTTIGRAIEAGTDGSVGSNPKLRQERTCNVPVEFRGRIYPSIAKAARMARVSEDTVVRECKRLNRRWFGGPHDLVKQDLAKSNTPMSNQPPTDGPVGAPASSAGGS